MQALNTSKAPVSLIIGAGEIGKGLFEVLEGSYKGSLFIRDIEEPQDRQSEVSVDILHICFPYFEGFVEAIQKYDVRYGFPRAIVIHSTVPVGTTEKIGENAVHSPVRGKHPRLAEGIRTFVKFFGGTDQCTTQFVEQYFARAGVRTLILSSSRATEMGKLMETTQYGWFIALAKEIKRVCEEQDLNFSEVYTLQNMTYNDGYQRLGMDHFVRPILTPVDGPIGGHCVVENCALMENRITKVVKEFNASYVEETKTTDPILQTEHFLARET